MINSIKRFASVVLSVLLVFSVIFSVNLQVNAATVEYVKSGKYIYNWGNRGEVATFLSPNADKFYKDNNTTFSKLASLSGSSNVSDAPLSALYKELESLMEKNHTHDTSYGETRNLYQYTDCQNSGKTSKQISSFYSGVGVGPSWDAGETWNREHTWPKSKTNYKSVENSDVNEATDIMSLRPTASSENTSRSNKAYGTTTNGTYFNPNHFANGKYDLRGDCARIMLYVYVRWGNTSKMWGGSGVIESKDVLLEWMKADPVDTWELGRNDSVESITGTRNVFVDYPELAFVLFGEQVPSDYTTPSGSAKNGVTTKPAPDSNQNNTQGNNPNNTQNNNQNNTQTTTPSGTACTHSKAYTVEPEDPRCEIEGYTAGKYCPDCKKYISGRTLIEPTGHTYAGDCDVDCDVCGSKREFSAEVKHNFGEDNICTICGTEDTINTDANTDVIDTTEPQNNGIVWWLVGGGVVIIVAGAVLLVVFRKKIWPEKTVE